MWRRLLAAASLAFVVAGPAISEPRVASLDQCSDEFVLALAPRGEIVGVSKRALNADSYLRTAGVGLPERRPSLEAVLGERATIAIRYWTPDARLPEALRRRGVAVVQLDEASDFEGVRRNVRKVAAALGRADAGEALIARMNAKLAQSRGAWGGARALYLTPGGFTAGPGSLVGAIMSAAGLVSVGATGGYAPVSLETLVLKPPAALVLGFFSDLAGGRQHWTIAGNGYLRGLIRERAIASLPGSMLGCPAWFAADGSLALARARPRTAS
jgi:iron complex transport system substrate-binding protein